MASPSSSPPAARDDDGSEASTSRDWNRALREEIAAVLAQPAGCLRRTDESVHHQKCLARRLQVARGIHDVWTDRGRDRAGLAEPMADGRAQSIGAFVAEAAEEDEVGTAGDIPVRDANDLSEEEFIVRYMLPNAPVLIRGIGKGWRSRQEWVRRGAIDAGFMSDAFGNSDVWVTNCAPGASAARTLMKAREFFERHWRDGEASDVRNGEDGDVPPPLMYLKDWHFASEHADYEAYVTPPYFREDWLNEYYIHAHKRKLAHACAEASPTGAAESSDLDAINESDYRFVYAGPKGTRTGLHADVLRSFSWSINVSGRKRWFLLSPKYTHLLYDGFGLELAKDFFDCDAQRFPNVAKARRHLVRCVQGEGEAIFVPSGWHHTVENLDATVSINHNWFNAWNVHYAWELLQRERHEAEQAIVDCRDMCDSPEEFEALVQRNVAANASMDYAKFAELLILIAESRGAILGADAVVKAGVREKTGKEEKGKEEGKEEAGEVAGVPLAQLRAAHELKVACSVLAALCGASSDAALIDRITQTLEGMRVLGRSHGINLRPASDA